MKIALISERYPPDVGGLAVSVARLAHLLAGAGHEVQVFSMSSTLGPGKFSSQARFGVLLHRMGVRKRDSDTLADWFDWIVAQYRRQPFDLVHAYFITRAGFMAVYVGRFLGVPSVVSARGNDLDRAIHDPRKAAHIYYALNNASAITANTRQLVRKAMALAPGPTVYRIPNGVDADLFQPQPRPPNLVKDLGLSDGGVIGFVGEARAKKGLSSLLLAFREIAERRVVDLFLLGGVRSGEDAELVEVFQKQNPGKRVLVLPFLELSQVPPYYSLMDVLVMPSLRDGLPNALLEGMACERAVVTTPVGGMLDIIRDGENGVLAPSGDPLALADAIEKLLSDPQRRRELGRSARQTVLQEFSLTSELEGVLTVYKKLLQAG
jgi:glycosyltransferase involved in cell wall biosynthesis